MRWALILAKEQGFSKVILEGDSKACLDLLLCPSFKASWLVQPLLVDISHMAKSFLSLQFCLGEKISNNSAHVLGQ